MESTPSVISLEGVEEDMLNPFARRPRLSHSPVRSTSSNTASCPGITDPVTTEPRKENEDNAFLNLGQLINDLREIIDSGKRSINQNFRDLVKAIGISYDQAAEDIGKAKGNIKVTKHSQTTPSLRRQITRETTRRAQVHGPGEILSTQGPPNKENNALKNIISDSQKTAMATKGGNVAADGAWTTVNKRQRVKCRPARPDAIIVRSTGKCSYAEILKTVKNEDSLKGMNMLVQKIRKTANGDLLLQLTKQSEANTAKLQAAVGRALSGKAEVKSLMEEILLEIRDIDEVTTVEEVRLALNSQHLNFNVKLSQIRSIRKAYGGTQTATVSLPSEAAKKLLEVGKVRIGWVICRIREKIQPRRCFKCLDFGHISRNCTSEIDLKGVCFKCGGEGHVAKTCTSAPKCLLCVKRQSKCTDHLTGGNRCPVFQEALQKIKQL